MLGDFPCLEFRNLISAFVCEMHCDWDDVVSVCLPCFSVNSWIPFVFLSVLLMDSRGAWMVDFHGFIGYRYPRSNPTDPPEVDLDLQRNHYLPVASSSHLDSRVTAHASLRRMKFN